MSRFPRTLPLVAIAAVLLAVSFSGGAVAAKMITGKQIKDNTLTTKDIKDRTLKTNDLSAAAIAALQAGATGPQGDPGPAGVSGLDYVFASGPVSAGGSTVVTATCPGAKRIVGITAHFQNSYLPTSTTFDGNNAGVAFAKNTSASSDTLLMSIACITAN